MDDYDEKEDIVLRWLHDVTNEDASWKYENVVIPDEWREFVDRQLQAKRRTFERKVDERKNAIEWIKTSKNVDFALDDDLLNYDSREKYLSLSNEDKEAVRQDKDEIVDSLRPFVEKTNCLERINSLRDLVKKPWESFISEYGDGIITDLTAKIIVGQMQRIADNASNSYFDDGELRVDYDEYTEDDKNFSREIEKGAENLSEAIHVADFSEDDQMINTYMDIVDKYPPQATYAKIHGINNERVEAYIKNVVPLINKRNSEVKRLWDNDYPEKLGFATLPYSGDLFGASDFCIHALTSRITPANTQELLLAFRDVSADNSATYEQNRNDAYELEGNIIASRRFIHCEGPGEHEILASMLKFYDTKDNPEEHAEAEKQLRTIQEMYDNERGYVLGKSMFDLNNYEKEEEQRKINGFRTGAKEKVVDALRRLVENTDPKLLEKPGTSDAELNDLIQNMYLDINKQNGEVYVDFKEVGRIVGRTNELLKVRQGTIGIKPSEVRSLAFVERVATFAMRGVSKKDRRELPFDSGFKEMCRFAELTSQSGNYNEVDFENFWKKFVRVRDFENEEELTEHFRMLSSRRLSQLRGLPEMTPFLKRESAALWSGNLNDELLQLVNER